MCDLCTHGHITDFDERLTEASAQFDIHLEELFS